jgi:hypothetical protein
METSPSSATNYLKIKHKSVFHCIIQQHVTQAAKWNYWLLVTEDLMQLHIPF